MGPRRHRLRTISTRRAARLLRAMAGIVAIAAAVAGPGRPADAAPRYHAELATEPAEPRAGLPTTLRFSVKDSLGHDVRFLQFVHERPLHLIVVSKDLADYAHIHPELELDDAYVVSHVFERAGVYRLFADYTPPGSGTLVDRFDLSVGGVRSPAPARPLVADRSLVRSAGGVRVTLQPDRPLRANEDVLLAASLTDAATGTPVTDLQLYLGALAHFLIVSEDLEDFIHAHPLETGEVFDPSRSPGSVHAHDPARLAKVLVGPSPSTIRAATSFPRAGLYKLWMQFQRAGHVTTVPFVVRVAPAKPVAARPAAENPRDAIVIRVDASGYTPARVEVRRGEPVVLAFTRPHAGNCGGTIVIPSLGVRRELPVGETVRIPLTAGEGAEIPFTCGMGMYQGLIVVK